MLPAKRFKGTRVIRVFPAWTLAENPQDVARVRSSSWMLRTGPTARCWMRRAASGTRSLGLADAESRKEVAALQAFQALSVLEGIATTKACQSLPLNLRNRCMTSSFGLFEIPASIFV